jgi:hypothetical protein
MRFALLLLAALPLAAATPRAIRAEARRICTQCHTWDVVRAQRLSRADWNAELRKMELMGAHVSNRDALLGYLAATFAEPPRPKRQPAQK